MTPIDRGLTFRGFQMDLTAQAAFQIDSLFPCNFLPHSSILKRAFNAQRYPRAVGLVHGYHAYPDTIEPLYPDSGIPPQKACTDILHTIWCNSCRLWRWIDWVTWIFWMIESVYCSFSFLSMLHSNCTVQAAIVCFPNWVTCWVWAISFSLIEMGVMVHKRHLADQIAFPGVSEWVRSIDPT